jgi:hypothetical protein
MTQRSETLAALAEWRKTHLEQDIIAEITALAGLGQAEAMGIYYRSQLARQIDAGMHGIHYLDAKYLAQDLCDNEPELFRRE